MSRIKVENTVTIYEVDGKEDKTLGTAVGLKVNSHWNMSHFITLGWEGSKQITVCASDLEKAIQNAKNAH